MKKDNVNSLGHEYKCMEFVVNRRERSNRLKIEKKKKDCVKEDLCGEECVCVTINVVCWIDNKV